EGFVDTIDGATTINDEQVNVDGFTDLLTGLTTQAQVNAKVDDLGSSTGGQGAELVALDFTPTAGQLLDGDATVGDAMDTLDSLKSAAKINANQTWTTGTTLTLNG